MTSPKTVDGAPNPGVGFREFVVLIGALNAINALGIDILIPALEAISGALRITNENDRQYVISAYILGFGVGQIFYGPLADRYGRRPTLIVGLGLFTVLSLIAALASSFELIIGARLLQGIGAAAARVVAMSVVRDCYSGRHMARINSLTTIVFLIVPILAPSIGQLLLMVGPWQWVLLFLAGFGLVDMLWVTLRLKETLRPEHRRPISVASILEAGRLVVLHRISIGYTVAAGLLFGALIGYINSIQQIFGDVFRAPGLLPIVFASAAVGLVFAAILNARIVERLGMRMVSHVALLGFIGIALLHAALSAAGAETMLSFAVLMAMQLFAFGMIQPNMFAMAMEPMGHVAGTASSIQGFISTVGGSAVGLAIGQAFDGTTLPLAIGFALSGIAALLVVLMTERGTLFRAAHRASA